MIRCHFYLCGNLTGQPTHLSRICVTLTCRPIVRLTGRTRTTHPPQISLINLRKLRAGESISRPPPCLRWSKPSRQYSVGDILSTSASFKHAHDWTWARSTSLLGQSPSYTLLGWAGLTRPVLSFFLPLFSLLLLLFSFLNFDFPLQFNSNIF